MPLCRSCDRSSEPDAARPRAPGKWSPKQVIGHLIDSASNNHQRFVRAQQGAELVFPPYAQDHWMNCQHYAERPWDDIVSLWHALHARLSSPPFPPPPPTILVSSDRFAEHQTPPGHPERPERAQVMDAVAARWRAGGGEVVAPRAATHEQLARVHDERPTSSASPRRRGGRSPSTPTPTRRRSRTRSRCWPPAPPSTPSSA